MAISTRVEKSSPKPREVRRFEAPRGWLEVGILAPGLVFQLADGHASTETAEKLTARLDELMLRFGKLELVNDWYGLSGYEPGARRVLERWTADNRASLTGIHVLVSSKLVAMAISVSNLVTGGATTSYTDRASFELALATALARRAT